MFISCYNTFLRPFLSFPLISFFFFFTTSHPNALVKMINSRSSIETITYLCLMFSRFAKVHMNCFCYLLFKYLVYTYWCNCFVAWKHRSWCYFCWRKSLKSAFKCFNATFFLLFAFVYFIWFFIVYKWEFIVYLFFHALLSFQMITYIHNILLLMGFFL